MSSIVFVELGKQQQWKSTPFTTSDIVLNAKAYDDDLGMKRYGEVFRQLQVDVPRCNVIVDGNLVTDANTIYRKAPFPRMSTQAVFAPVLEWLMSNGVMASEHSLNRSLLVDIDTKELTMSITKRFRLLSIHGFHICNTIVNIHVHSPSNMLVISNCPY
jgi:hypothetical protein